MGEHVPVWDIRDRFGDTNLLVTNIAQGRDLEEVYFFRAGGRATILTW